MGLTRAQQWQKSFDNLSLEDYWGRIGPRIYGASNTHELARQLLPRSCAHWRREALLQALTIKEDDLDNLLHPFPFLREIKDPDVRRLLGKRLRWKERKVLFSKLASSTGDTRDWDLHHPFDDLDGREMRQVLTAATKMQKQLPLLVSKRDLGDLQESDFALLERADQWEFLLDLLRTPEERRALAAENKQRREEEDAAALRQHQKELADARKRDAAMQKQQKIDKAEKQAKYALHLALQLDTRGGFDKEVRERLQKIIDQFPGTPSAAKARQKLERMQP
ncbi:MAG: hypothetical protein ACYC3I_17190 [Gemmataceae bacterium]